MYVGYNTVVLQNWRLVKKNELVTMRVSDMIERGSASVYGASIIFLCFWFWGFKKNFFWVLVFEVFVFFEA
jgi:hypothetical protein